MLRYRVPRFVIGPKTTEIILDIGRSLNVGDDVESAELHARRRKCGKQPTYVFKSYASCDNVIHFQIPDEFITSEVPRGFYDVDVVVDGCVVTNIEIIKAPSRYVKDGKSVDNDCHVGEWQEPPCEDEVVDCNKCGGLHPVAEGCPACTGTEILVASPIQIDSDYLGEDDV